MPVMVEVFVPAAETGSALESQMDACRDQSVRGQCAPRARRDSHGKTEHDTPRLKVTR